MIRNGMLVRRPEASVLRPYRIELRTYSWLFHIRHDSR